MKSKTLAKCLTLGIVLASGYLVGSNFPMKPRERNSETGAMVVTRLDRTRSIGSDPTQFRLPEGSPDKAARDFAASGMAAKHPGIHDELLLEWGRDDPVGALAFITSEMQGISALSVRVKLMAGWVTDDPEAAFEHLRTLPDTQATEEFTSALIGHWGESDVGTLREFLEKSGRGENRHLAIEKITSLMIADDRAATLSWIAGALTGHEKLNATNSFYDHITRQDPPGAVATIAALPESEAKAAAMHYLAAAWAEKDAQGALAWLETLPESGRKTEYRSTIIQRMISDDPARAEAVVRGISDPVLRGHMLDSLAAELGKRDSQAALEWAGRLDPERKDSAMLAIHEYRATDFPLASFEEALAYPDPQTSADMVVRSMVSLVASDPEGAAELIPRISDPAAKARALDTLLGEWLRTDRAQAHGWMTNVKDPAVLDRAIKSVVDQVGGYDPAYAMAWAHNVSDPTLRASLTREAAGDLARKDRKAAESAMIEAGIGPVERLRILDYGEEP